MMNRKDFAIELQLARESLKSLKAEIENCMLQSDTRHIIDRLLRSALFRLDWLTNEFERMP